MEYCVSKVLDQNGLPFVEAPDGGIDFGHITVEQNLTPAPIRLSIGDRMSIVLAFCRKDTGETRKTSGLLPNCRMRNRLPVILRNLQQMPIKRQAQTVLYPMFPNAKIQLFHKMQVLIIKITTKYYHHVKNYYLCHFISRNRAKRIFNL